MPSSRSVAAPELGILLDTYHVWDDPERAALDRRPMPPTIVGVHVGDWPALDRTDRVLPGEGISRTRELVAALVAAGWDGALDVEIFSTPELFWGLPVDEAARRALCRRCSAPLSWRLGRARVRACRAIGPTGSYE